MGVDLPKTGPVPLEAPRQQETKPDNPPVPTPRPGGDTTQPQDPDTAADASSPAPARSKPDKPAPLPDITTPKADEAALASCEAELRKLGAEFDRVDPIVGDNGCGIEAPYRVERIVRGVTLSPATQMRCKTALALARWIDAVAIPAAEALPDAAVLTRVNHGSTYVCRRRNNLPTGKMSEHSIGNAIDVMSFVFSERAPIPVSPRAGDGTVEEAFQRAVRGGACLHFTTVLGPGSDTSHQDHLHLDIAERRGGYRLCQ